MSDTTGVEWHDVPTSVRAAVDRALNRHQRDALSEVEQILNAALRVAVRVSPAEPKVADIVAEAGTSNQTFYRYFAGKNELMHAVLERGIMLVNSYLRHQMAKHSEPVDQLTAWVEGMIAQITRPTVAQQGTTVNRLLARAGESAPGRATLDGQLGDLLIAPLTAAGRPRPDLDARVIQDAVLGTMQRHVEPGTIPDEDEQRHLVDFCVAVIEHPPAARGE
ncbi:TetR family transcriptional regulator [Frankia sp. CcI49]|uniref:DNA-binding transcriptional regulator, AcrR family n=1 Tax=Parafrankia irregularis TaxID=795642 RepID=A0A0S4QS61_9ACTN|nr:MULTISPECIES: TetR/AcrR family transcriptional regulator [Frankiaceae]MBE3204391.1 TetR/AcrR family transcriptional regulator [Parafrankia sp. CH37]ONH58570.1 TetR family transcriptional regulator [Frankia sp. CcI49]CUU57660.1 DNA-binding transcriptional regulator, AcrR family [Parafrankia irregularis]